MKDSTAFGILFLLMIVLIVCLTAMFGLTSLIEDDNTIKHNQLIIKKQKQNENKNNCSCTARY